MCHAIPGSLLNKTANDFDPRNYGFKRLSELINAIGLFETAQHPAHYKSTFFGNSVANTLMFSCNDDSAPRLLMRH